MSLNPLKKWLPPMPVNFHQHKWSFLENGKIIISHEHLYFCHYFIS